ncbi:MAG: hypothetical protein ACOVOQ_15345 [Flavobacterium sp.]
MITKVEDWQMWRYSDDELEYYQCSAIVDDVKISGFGLDEIEAFNKLADVINDIKKSRNELE